MTKPETFQEQIDALAYGEVHPLLFATDIHHRDRLEVHVVLISPPDQVEISGYSSTMPIFSRYFDLREDLLATDAEVRQMRLETIGEFAQRLRRVLAMGL